MPPTAHTEREPPLIASETPLARSALRGTGEARPRGTAYEPKPRRPRQRIIMDYDLAMAFARDEGNRSMRAAGRSAWNEEDWNAMCDGFQKAVRIMPPELRALYTPPTVGQAEQDDHAGDPQGASGPTA